MGIKRVDLIKFLVMLYQIRIKAKALKKDQSKIVLFLKMVLDVGYFLPDFCAPIFILIVKQRLKKCALQGVFYVL